jgi:serine phosphatase RsbU (regulator of sigma subunit)
VRGFAPRVPFPVESDAKFVGAPSGTDVMNEAEPEGPWALAPHPVLVVDARGLIREVSGSAHGLMPDAAPLVPLADAAPGWLADAHRALCAPYAPLPAAAGDRPAGRRGPPAAVLAPRPARGTFGEAAWAAHPAVLGDGAVMWWLTDDSSARRTEEALLRERERTAFLSEASTLLLASLNIDRCMDLTAQLAARHLADAALVVAPGAGRRLPITSCTRDGEPQRRRLAVDPAAVPGLDEALQGFPPVPSRWIDPALAPGWVLPEDFGDPGTMVVTPLPGHGVAAGALILLRHSRNASFTEGEEVFARLFAARAGAAMSAARLYAEQASLTRVLMRELLPPPVRDVDGVEFAAGYRASADGERIGGDFYDVHPTSGAGDEALAVLGDVCGKGVEAAVMTGKIRNTLHALLPMADDHRRMLSLLNDALLDSDHARFATLVLASVARDGDAVRLRLTSAGHPAPLLLRSDGRVEQAATRGTLVGALPRIEAVTATASLAPGETCLLFTDGITEAKGGPLGDDFFGEARLHRGLRDCAGMPAAAVVERVQMLASEWVGVGRHDDMALIAITAPRTPAGRTSRAVESATAVRYRS